MNDKKYVEEVCSKCENKLNDKDLCDIRITINGNANCVNYKEIKEAEKISIHKLQELVEKFVVTFWENLKNDFNLMIKTIKKYLLKPAYLTLSIFSLYFFINDLIHYEIILAFGNLFAAILFFNLFKNEE